MSEKLLLTAVSQSHVNDGAVLPAEKDEIIADLLHRLDKLNFKYNAVFNSDDSHFIILDTELCVVDFNIAFGVLIKAGTGKDIQIGEHISGFVDGLAQQVLKNCKRALAGEIFIIERKLTYANDENWWEAEYAPAYDADRNIAGVIFNAMNITRRKNHEIKIEAQNDKLKAISLMQSHDIRGPLCTLMGLMELIRIEGIDQQDSGYFHLINIAIEQLDDKIKGIVNYANED